MEQNIIGEPQLSHLLEFLIELGSAADDFVLAGAQAMRFFVNEARTTRDFDFVLDVIALRETSQSIADVLEKLQYKVVPEASRFQFFKQIPNSLEIMRVEFLAPEKEKRPNNFRVDVQQNIHARACTGAEIVLRESDCKIIRGTLPNGKPAEASLRVICPHALLMLKLFAMDDRYKNIRGPKEAQHDRDEARIHAADIVTIVRSNIQSSDFKRLFLSQFSDEVKLKQRTLDIISNYFVDSNASGILLYAEFLRMQGMAINEDDELKRALREVKLLLPEQDLMKNKIVDKSRSD
jgi:hypothetical protein